MNKVRSFLHKRRPFPIPQSAPRLPKRPRREISDASYPKHRTFRDKFFLVHVPNHRNHQSQKRKNSLREENSYGIDRSTKNIETALQDQPRKANLALHILYTIYLKAMQHGKYRRQSHGYKHSCSKRPPCRRPELGRHRQNGATKPKERDLKIIFS